MRQRSSAPSTVTASETEEMLDTQEQRSLVEELSATATQHARTWHCAFGALSGLVGLAFIWFTARQAAEPWTGYRHHAAFRGVLPAAAVAVIEGISAAVLLLTALFLLQSLPNRHTDTSARSYRASQKRQRQQIEANFFTAAAAAVVWLIAIAAAGVGASGLTFRSQLNLTWLPALPLLFAILGIATLRSEADSIAAIAHLKTQMYMHEKL